MKLIALAFCVLVATVVATPNKYRSHPRPENDPSYHYSQTDRSEENSYALRNIVNRIPSSLLDRVPNAGDILSMPQEALARRNAEEIVNILYDVCHAAIATESIKPTFAPNKQQINVQLMTRDGDTTVTLAESQRLFELPSFNDANDVVVFITGWKLSASEEDSALTKLKEAYQCRGNVNFILIDLGRQMADLQSWLSLDNEQVGQFIGEFITELAKKVSVNRIHLIGHSVGAHLAGAASRKFTETTGNILPRITALDPATLCYREKQTLSGLQRGDAAFVDVIHTSSYGLGKPEPIGDVDFFPNGPSILQPGTRDLVSAHSKAIEYFAETVIPGHEENFIAQKCNSMKNLRSTVCQQKQIPMGISTPTDAKGNFFLQTKHVSPYGYNANSGARNIRCRGH